MKSATDVSGFPKGKSDELRERFLEWRGIDSPCQTCGGSGYVAYGSTSTYWGGVGGATMTKGPCDKCWGSGEADRPWPSHKEFYNLKKAAEKRLVTS